MKNLTPFLAEKQVSDKRKKMSLPSPLSHVGMLRDFSWSSQVTIYFLYLISRPLCWGRQPLKPFIFSGCGSSGLKHPPLSNVKLATPSLGAVTL